MKLPAGIFSIVVSLTAIAISSLNICWNLCVIDGRNKANQAGYQARKDGLPRHACPHTDDREIWWGLGWFRANNELTGR